MKTLRVSVLSILLIPLLASAQIIPIKTVPVATGDQFAIFPSHSLSMGGISLTLDDELLDPFVNPAKGIRLQGMKVVSAPNYYGVSLKRGSSYDGSGFSLPIGLLFKSESLFGGLYLAKQSLGSEYSNRQRIGGPILYSANSQGESGTTNNTYSFAMAGTTIPGTEVAIAASGFWADLNRLEGVQLLFPNNPGVKQDGSASEYRLALLSELQEHEFFDLTLVRSDFSMRYDVLTYRGPGLENNGTGQQTVTSHHDETNLWGVRVAYRRPLIGSWTIGAEATANWKTHPKIPNYELMSIPRDPGNSTAYNFGIGISTRSKESLFGLDLVFEPIRTETWAGTDVPVTTWNNALIPAGGKTVENFFDFSNWILRSGFRASNGFTEFQAGIRVHAISYNLFQIDHVQSFQRNQKESWQEWTFSMGLGLRFSSVHLLYNLLLTTGTGQPGISSFTTARTSALAAADFLPAPGGQLALREAWVFQHQISLSVDIQ